MESTVNPNFYLNVYYNRHAKIGSQYFIKTFIDPETAKTDADSYFGFITTLEIPKAMIEFFDSKDEALLK